MGWLLTHHTESVSYFHLILDSSVGLWAAVQNAETHHRFYPDNTSGRRLVSSPFKNLCMGLLPHGPLPRYVKLRVVHVLGTFSSSPGVSDPDIITARVWCPCRDACRDRLLAFSVDVNGGENVPGIPDACTTRNFTYLVRGAYAASAQWIQNN